MSKRISHLKSCDLSTSGRKLRSRKIVTSNKNLKKSNVSIKSSNVRASKKNVSVQKDSQTLLTRLRPRQNKRNYCEDSKLLQQHISPKQQSSKVVLEKLNIQKIKNDKKVPVYKAIEPEKSSEDENNVYDFKFDIHDPKEKTSKKRQLRKRNVNKEKNKIIKKTTRKKVQLEPKLQLVVEIHRSPELDMNNSVQIVQRNPLETEPIEKDIKKEVQIKKEIPKIDTDIQTTADKLAECTTEILEASRTDVPAVKETSVFENTFVDIPVTEEISVTNGTLTEEIKENDANQPKIISIENANNIVVTKTSPNLSNNSEDSRLFRPKNIFDNKNINEHDSTLKCSLMKTLSPIMKVTNTFDTGSPWRPPILTFSQTKHFIQSTPYKSLETHKENKETKRKNIEKNKEKMEMNKENMEMDKENMEMDKENMEMDKENIDVNKENKGRRNKERKKKKMGRVQNKVSISKNQSPEKVRAAVASKSNVQPAPVRVSLGEIKNILQRSNVNEDSNKQAVDQSHTEIDTSHVEQKKFVDFLNFSDTFDVLSESERLSNIGKDAPLFMDLEPSYFSKPPQHSYKRKRVNFDFSENNEEEEKDIEKPIKKKKITKLEKERNNKIREWIKTINTTFQEIEEHDLIIE